MTMRREDLTVGQTVTHAAGVEGVIEWVGWTMVGISRESMVGIVAEWRIGDLVAPEPPKAKPGQRYRVAGFTFGALGLVDGRIISLGAMPAGPFRFDPTMMTEWPYEDHE